MDPLLATAAGILVAVGAVHSYLGERFILIPLFRGDALSKIGPGRKFAKGALRFSWHLVTITWVGFAAVLSIIALGSASLVSALLVIVVVVFGLHSVAIFGASRGKHVAWIAFAGVAVLTGLAIGSA